RLDELTIHGAPASGAQQTPPPAWNEPESPSIDETARSYVAPQTDIEKRLAEIWSQVLGVEQIGIHDNFFELGGDSIISIQIIAKANQHGLRLTPKQFFQQQTIAELATVVGTTPTVKAEQGIVTGALPLTPIQRRFFKQNLPRREYFNQSILLEVDRPLIPALVEQTVQHLLAHHDALRLRYTPTEENEWQQRNAETGDAAPFSALDFSALPEAEQQAAIEAAIETMQASLNISDGPLIKVAHIACGESRANLLLLVVHHLAIDVVSWRILLEDLQAVYQHLSEGKKPSLPAKTTSFKQWAERLSQHVRGGGFREEIAYWTDELRNQPRPLPSDHPAGQANTLESARVVSTKLEASATRALLVDVPQAYHTQINDVLLTALVQAFAGWTGTRSLLVEMEGHGRESIFEDVDLSRTVGWFTSVFPVLLDLGRNGDSPGDELKAVKEKLRRLPNRGIGYGLLGHLSVDTEVVELWKTFPQPQVSFNYLGQFEQEAADASIFGRVRDARGASPLMPGDRTHLLEIDAKVVGEQLQVSWTYSENAHRRATVEALAENFNERLRALGQHCLSPEAGGYTPSDFPEAELSQADLDNLLASLNA
ncbi:MAG TPA: condensation domain-containing protein, partial [Pyrinomonadaceae bacterium]